MAANSDKPNKLLVLAFLFVISYAFLYIVSTFSEPISSFITAVDTWVEKIPIINSIMFLVKSILPLPAFSSPMFYLLPVVGFFTIYLLVDWINEQFKTKVASSVWLPLLFFVLCIVAFYIASYWYYCNAYSMSSSPPAACSADGSKFTSEMLSTNFSKLFRESAFDLFMWAGILGWLARFAIKELLKE